MKKTPSYLLLGATMLLASCFFPAPVRAAQPISLKDALAMARERSPVLQAARQATTSADEDMKIARSAFFPDVGVFAGYSATNQPVGSFGMKLNQGIITQEDFDPALLNNPDFIDNFGFGVRFHQPIYTGGRLRWGYRGAEMGREAVLNEESQTTNEVLFQVIAAYLDALRAREQERLLEESVQLAEGFRDKVADLHDQGMVTKADLLSAKVRLARLEHDLLTVRESIHVADIALSAAVGATDGEIFAPAGHMEEPAGEPEDRQVWLDRAYAERPDLRALELRVEQSRAGARMARGARLPGVELRGGYEWDDGGFFDDPHGNYSLGLEVGLSVFDGGGRAAREVKRKSEAERLDRMAQALRQQIRVEVEHSLTEMETSRGQVRVSDEAIDQAAEAFRIISDRYEAGLADAVEVLKAEVDLTDSRVQRNEALFRYHRARAMLRKSAGLAPE